VSRASADLPVLAVVGRPNVGKSTLVNRILGRREAVVEDVPGVTRDRVRYDAEWRGRHFVLMDTGGWEPRARGLAGAISDQARGALDEADAVLFVVDASTGVTDVDLDFARAVQKTNLPVVLAANKVDDMAAEAAAAELWSLALGEPMVVSALHGRGSGEILDAILEALPENRMGEPDAEGGPRRVALVGRPNVGKSSLLNRVAGSSKSLVDDVAGTTRDPVDSEVQIGEHTYLFVDTAGLRRRVDEASGAEFYASVRTRKALERAEVALLVLDAGARVTEQDQRIANLVIETGRALVIGLNKWDLVDEDRRYELERELPAELGMVAWAPRINLSALTGRAIDKLPRALEEALAGWETRIPTGRLNAWLGDIVAATPPPARGGRAPKIQFATQAAISPPRIVIFSTRFIEEGYRRFLMRKLREDFGFAGTPIELSIRVKGQDTGQGSRSGSR
jgi:GTP-binding protein